jgi:zinc protease
LLRPGPVLPPPLLAAVGALAGVLAVSLLGAPARAAPAAVTERLGNGLTLIVLPDGGAPADAGAVHVELWYRAGNRDDPPGRPGLVHLVAHLFERGTRHHGDRAYRSQLLAAGASIAPLETGPDYTRFAVTAPASELERVLWLESSRMGWIFDRPGVRSAVADERAVIAHERARDHARPAGAAGGAAGGTPGATPDEVERCYDRSFGPDNAVLVLAGDVEPARARQLVSRYFGTLPPGRPPARPPVDADPAPLSPDGGHAGGGGAPGALVVAWPSAAAYADGEAALEVAAEYLGGGPRPRLVRRLVDELRLARRIGVRQTGGEQRGRFEIAAELVPGADARAALAALDAELAAVRGGKPGAIDAAELAGARARVRTQRLLALASPAGRARLHARYRVLAGDAGFLRRDLERLAAVDGAVVAAVLADRLRDEARVVLAGGTRTGPAHAPEAAPAPAAVAAAASSAAPAPPRRSPDAAFRARPPEPASASAPARRGRAGRPRRAPPPVERFQLPEGLPVALIHAPDARLVRAELVISAGEAEDGPGAGGAAAATAAPGAHQAAALLATARRRPDQAPALEQLARLGALGETRVSPRAIHLTMVLPPADLGRAAALWRVALDPARWTGPAAELAAARASFTAQCRADRATLVLAGDVSPAAARAAFAGLVPRPPPARPARRPARAPRPLAAAPAAAPAGRTRLVLRDRPGAATVEVRLGATGVGPGSRDRAALLVTHQLLAGELGRLDRRLRLEKGWALSVGGVPGVGPGRWTLEATLSAAQAAPGVRELLRAVALLAAGEVTEAEVARARGTLIHRRPVERANPFALAQLVAEQEASGHDPGDLAAAAPGLAAVGTAEVTRVARAYLAPDRATLTVTGDRRRLEPALEELGLEPARPTAPAAAMR